MKHFKCYSREYILSLTNLRRFETKIGESLTVLQAGEDALHNLARVKSRFVLLGIPEDLGVKANYGKGGADTLWQQFLAAFLNVQSNDFLTGEELLLLGHFDFGDLEYLVENNARDHEELIDAYRHSVKHIDDEVEALLKIIAAAGKIPIVIGGGHNNAYPVIKGVAKGLQRAGATNRAQLNAINLDAHADFRGLEGRHSGNSFRYAMEDGFLAKYNIIGLHENYVSQNVLSELEAHPFVEYTSYESIFLHETQNFIQAVARAAAFTDDTYTGIELDLDSIENVLASASTPCGITPLHARQFIHFVAQASKPAYLHICEGAAQLQDGLKSSTTGKLVSYLVTDFIKAVGNA